MAWRLTFSVVLWLAATIRCGAADPPRNGAAPESAFTTEELADRLVICRGQQPLATFVHRDVAILRPYFCNLRSLRGLPVTRSQPPVEGVDATDHATMHPGMWLGLGDVNGQDFWRNKGRIEHVRFSEPPQVKGEQVAFSTESRMLAADGSEVGRMANRYEIAAKEFGWLLVWTAEFQTVGQQLVFGDQEEMGFGVRLAMPLTEKNGGRITNSAGQSTAAATWGQPADWCDYSGAIDSQPVGITVLAAPTNFRRCWWHNRDYGLMVANPFGRAAMKQGDPSRVTIAPGDRLRLTFAACIHDGPGYDPRDAWERWQARTE